MAESRKALLKEISEGLMMKVRGDMERHPDQFAAKDAPTQSDIIAFLQTQADEPKNTSHYLTMMTEAIERKLRKNLRLITD